MALQNETLAQLQRENVALSTENDYLRRLLERQYNENAKLQTAFCQLYSLMEASGVDLTFYQFSLPSFNAITPSSSVLPDVTDDAYLRIPQEMNKVHAQGRKQESKYSSSKQAHVSAAAKKQSFHSRKHDSQRTKVKHGSRLKLAVDGVSSASLSSKSLFSASFDDWNHEELSNSWVSAEKMNELPSQACSEAVDEAHQVDLTDNVSMTPMVGASQRRGIKVRKKRHGKQDNGNGNPVKISLEMHKKNRSVVLL